MVLYVHNSLNFKILKKLSINSNDLECACIEIVRKNAKNIIVSCIYRPPRGDSHKFLEGIKTLICKNQEKPLFLVGDLNMNSLDYSINTIVRDFFNLIFQNGIFPLINRPTRVTKSSATIIDHVLTNTIIDSEVQSGIIKTDISDHFAVFALMRTSLVQPYLKKTSIKRDVNEDSIKYFNSILNSVDWDLITQTTTPDSSYNIFLDKFIKLYDIAFPERKVEKKQKNLTSPWITRGLKKSSKRKQRLYDKFLKRRNDKNEKVYKMYKSLFEKLKLQSKKLYFQNKLKQYENNIKNTWKIMKVIIGKSKVYNDNFPKILNIDKKEITYKKTIAEEFNSYFINVGPKLATKIPPSNTNFESYLPNITTSFLEKPLKEKEFKDAFFALKTNKSPGNDNLHVNVIRKLYHELKIPLMNIFSQSLKKGIFPEKMKIAKVSPIFKKGDKSILSNYRPISVLPCFSKILECIMYNRLYAYVAENNILFNKQFGFRAGHSTEHALLELIDQINDSFNGKSYFLGIFIDLSKAFDTVDHKILLKKLQHYRIKGKNLSWFESYLTGRKQYIKFEINDYNGKTGLLKITCGVPQGSILGPLLFIIYINALCQVSDILKLIMFADDTNLFCSSNDIKTLFFNTNLELQKISGWFRANKLSLNEDKTTFTLFHRIKDRDNLPLRLPILKINDYDIKRSSSIKFLGVLVDEHLSWTDHINILENKLSKNLGLLYKSKHFLNANGMKSLYYSFFHSYLNYGNIAWCSTSVTKIKKLYSKQKQAIKALSVASEDYSGLKIGDLMEKTSILNIYKLNIYHVINLMFRVKNNTIPEAFVNKFEIVHHHYQTRHSENNFIEPKIYFTATKFAISSRGPRLWNSLTDKDIKTITSTPLFKRRLKNHLIKIKNITNYL